MFKDKRRLYRIISPGIVALIFATMGFLVINKPIKADTLNEGHTCDQTDPYCVDILDLLPEQSIDVSTRDISQITNKQIDNALDFAQKRVEKYTGKKVSEDTDAATRRKNNEETMESNGFIDAVISVDYYNYEKKYGARPVETSAQARNSANELTFEWNDKAIIEGGMTEANLNSLKNILPAIYKAHRKLFGPPISSTGSRKIKISPNPINNIFGKGISGGFYIPPLPITLSGAKAVIGDGILITTDLPLPQLIRTLAHEMSHAWRGNRVLTLAGSSQMEEGLAEFSEIKVLELMVSNYEELGFDKKIMEKEEDEKMWQYLTQTGVFPNYDFYHDDIYSKAYDGKMNFASLLFSDSGDYIHKKYELGAAAMGKLYLANKDFVGNLHQKLAQSTQFMTLTDSELREIIISAVGEKTIVDRQYASDFVKYLPLFKEKATTGKFVVGESDRFGFISKDVDGLATGMMGSGDARFNNSFGWSSILENNNGWSLDKMPSARQISPIRRINFGQFWFKVGDFTGDKQTGFAYYQAGSELNKSLELFNVAPLPPNLLKYPPDLKKGKEEGIGIYSYLAEKQKLPEEKIAAGQLMGVIDTTGNALSANFYCNEKPVDSKSIFASTAAKQYNSEPAPVQDSAINKGEKIYYLPTYSSEGCSGNASVVVKMRERGGGK